jgi:hypothetical protein
LATVEQQENKVEYSTGGDVSYGEVNAGTIDTPSVIPARGGSVNITFTDGSQTVTTTAIHDYYTSTSSRIRETAKTDTVGVVGTASKTTVTAKTKGSTVSEQTEVETVTVTWKKNGKQAKKSVTVYQAANRELDDLYDGAVTVNVSVEPTVLGNTSGNKATISRSGTVRGRKQYSSNVEMPYTLTKNITPILSISDTTNFSLNGTTISTRTANTSSKSRSCIITATYNTTTNHCSVKQSGSPQYVFEVLDSNNATATTINYAHPSVGYKIRSSYTLDDVNTPVDWSIVEATTNIPNGHTVYVRSNSNWVDVTSNLSNYSVAGGSSQTYVFVGPSDPGSTYQYWIKPDLNNLIRASLINGDYNLQLTFKQNGQSATTSRKVIYKQTLTNHLVYQVSANTADSVSFDATGGTLTV